MNGMGVAIVLQELIPSSSTEIETKMTSLKNEISISYNQERLMPATMEFLKLFEK